MLKVVHTNVTQHSIIPNPPMYCFGGQNVCVEIGKVKKVDKFYWHDTDNDFYIPVLYFELEDGTRVSVDYATDEERDEALKTFQKSCVMKVVK